MASISGTSLTLLGEAGFVRPTDDLPSQGIGFTARLSGLLQAPNNGSIEARIVYQNADGSFIILPEATISTTNSDSFEKKISRRVDITQYTRRAELLVLRPVVAVSQGTGEAEMLTITIEART